MASQITSPTIVCSAVHSDERNIKAPRHWPLWGNSPVTGEFPTQRASNAEYVSIWWRHHEHSKHAMQCGTAVILESISGICSESLATRLFVQQLIQTKKTTRFKIQDSTSTLRIPASEGNHGLEVVSPHKGPWMLKAFSCHGVVMATVQGGSGGRQILVLTNRDWSKLVLKRPDVYGLLQSVNAIIRKSMSMHDYCPKQYAYTVVPHLLFKSPQQGKFLSQVKQDGLDTHL